MTQEKALELFEYKDGFLYSKLPRGRWGRNKAGELVGTFDTTKGVGYYVVNTGSKNILLHRIIFLMFNGYMPFRVDHIDGDTKNNKIENLREATQSQNLYNRGKAKNNTSGFKGVCWDKKSKKWFAQIQVEKKQINIGHYDTAELAHAAYLKAAAIHHKEFAHG